MNAVSPYSKNSLMCIGYHLDVVSLAKSSMVSKIWRTAFGDHIKWKYFYENSNEYGMLPLPMDGKWRLHYGELYDKCNDLIKNVWKILFDGRRATVVGRSKKRIDAEGPCKNVYASCA
jgi:hypothetical protein